MKENLFRLCAVSVALLLLCACGQGTQAIPFTLDHAPDGPSYTLGMARDELEALAPWTSYQVETNDVLLVTYVIDGDTEESQGLTVRYQDGNAAALSAGDPMALPEAPAPWSVQGITLGSTREEVKAAFGYPTQSDASLGDRAEDEPPPHFSALRYDYLSDGTLLAAATGDQSYTLFFFLLDGKVSHLSLYFRGQGPNFDAPDTSEIIVTAASDPDGEP